MRVGQVVMVAWAKEEWPARFVGVSDDANDPGLEVEFFSGNKRKRCEFSVVAEEAVRPFQAHDVQLGFSKKLKLALAEAAAAMRTTEDPQPVPDVLLFLWSWEDRHME